MTIETILEYLNRVAVRATYGAVAKVLDVRPQVVPRLLGEQRPEASWIVNGSTGEPTGYTPDQVDPRLPGTHVIRTGDELRSCVEGNVPAPAPPAPAQEVNGASSSEAPEATSGETSELDVITMGNDAKWIIGTLVPVVLLVAGLLSAQIASVGNREASTEAVNDSIDDLRADLTAQIAEVDTRIGNVRGELGGEITALRSEVEGFAARLTAIEAALGLSEPDPATATAAGEQTAEPDAPAADPEAAADSEAAADPEAAAAEPDAPDADPEAPAADPEEPATDPDEPAAEPDESDAEPDAPDTEPDEPEADPAPPGE